MQLDLLGPEQVAPKDHVLEPVEFLGTEQARSLFVLVKLSLFWLRSAGP